MLMRMSKRRAAAIRWGVKAGLSDARYIARSIQLEAEGRHSTASSFAQLAVWEYPPRGWIRGYVRGVVRERACGRASRAVGSY